MLIHMQVLILKGLCDWRMEDNEAISDKMREDEFATSLVYGWWRQERARMGWVRIESKE